MLLLHARSVLGLKPVSVRISAKVQNADSFLQTSSQYCTKQRFCVCSFSLVLDCNAQTKKVQQVLILILADKPGEKIWPGILLYCALGKGA